MASAAEVSRNLLQQVGDQLLPGMPAELVVAIAQVNAILAVADQLQMLRDELAMNRRSHA